MLKDLTFDHGLPLKQKDLEMIYYAKAKREMESHLPPFTVCICLYAYIRIFSLTQYHQLTYQSIPPLISIPPIQP